MLQYLGVTKKKGADDSKILKNAWISLHMHGLSARQWADSMFLNDTPGDELTLYILCKMFQQHAIVFTSAKYWTTLETDAPCSEDEIFDTCDIRLLYIEPGVFGELRKRARMPPPPFQNGIFESASAIIPQTHGTSVDVEPLNLSMHRSEDPAINASADQDIPLHENQYNLDPYLDAPLSGGLEIIICDLLLDPITTITSQEYVTPIDTGDNILSSNTGTLFQPENSIQPTELTKTIQQQMVQCMVRLRTLTDNEINMWCCPQIPSAAIGYSLHDQQKPALDPHLADKSKTHVSYILSCSSSQDEECDDPSVAPGKWHRK